MDKQKGLDILGLGPFATCADARKAFRILAKTWHPDRFANDPLNANIAEEKMKQVNEAFGFLLPLLPESAGVQSAPKASSATGPDRVQAHGPGNASPSFFSLLADGLKKWRNKINGVRAQGSGSVGKTQPSGPRCNTEHAGKRGKIQFETLFQNAVHHGRPGTVPRFNSSARIPGCHARRKAMAGPAYGRYRNLRLRKYRGTGPVEKISTIVPVSPIGKDR